MRGGCASGVRDAKQTGTVSDGLGGGFVRCGLTSGIDVWYDVVRGPGRRRDGERMSTGRPRATRRVCAWRERAAAHAARVLCESECRHGTTAR